MSCPKSCASEIDIKQIYKCYKPGLFKHEVKALRGVSFSVSKGEVFGLVGPNGAGKSTTIRAMLGLVQPDKGEIFFRGELGLTPALLREIGYLPENPYLYDHLTLDELLFFCGRTSGMTSAQIKGQGQSLTNRLDLANSKKRPLRAFSKGMLQRAGICFALLHDPSIVIFDEPMSGLDPVGRKMVFDLVMELKAQGKTIFFCSHILSDVERLCDRIGLMAKGRMLDVFNSHELTASRKGRVHLKVAGLPPEYRQYLSALVESIDELDEGLLISCSSEKLSAVVTYLGEIGVSVLGSREESRSLEELFMQAVREAE